jgi:P4 family phage/plasmid primase-like protien
VTDTVHDVLARHENEPERNTDTGNARRFVRVLGDVVAYVVEDDLWLVWDGTRWAPDPGAVRVTALTEEVVIDMRAEALSLPDEAPDGGGASPREALLRWATRSEAREARLKTYKLAATYPRLQVADREALDASPDDLVCLNGTVNLLTGELRPSSPADRNTHCCGVRYAPELVEEGKTHPELERFLETFLPDEREQEVLFALLGSAVRGGNAARALPLLVGATTSGKSQLVAALSAALGSYAVAVNPSVFRGNLDDRPRPDLVRAMFARLAVASEASTAWELHADQVKRLTGGDRIAYRALYSGTVEHTPRFTPLVVTNELPRVRGADAALKKRIVVVRMNRTLAPELVDPAVKERFVQDVGPGGVVEALLARVIAGARSPLFRDGIHWERLPPGYELDASETFEALDHVGDFLRWLREEGVLVEVPSGGENAPAAYTLAQAKHLHEWYTLWVKKYGDAQDRRDALSLRALGQTLRGRGWQSTIAAGTRWLGWTLTREVGAFDEL